MLRFGHAFLVLGVLASCGGDDGGGDPVAQSARQVCLDMTNQFRAGAGRPPVVQSAALEAYADEGAAYDFHNPDPPHAHFRNTNGGGIAFAENQCPQWPLSFAGGDLNMLVAQCMQAFFDEGPGGGHYDNMMGNYGTLGCGLYQESGMVTIIQDYGR